MVGLGGVMTDLLRDRAFAVPPLGPGVADAMVASLRAAPLLDGYRGAPKVDRQGLVRVLEQIAHIAEEVPEPARNWTSTPSWSVRPGRSSPMARRGWPRASPARARCFPRCADGHRFELTGMLAGALIMAA